MHQISLNNCSWSHIRLLNASSVESEFANPVFFFPHFITIFSFRRERNPKVLIARNLSLSLSLSLCLFRFAMLINHRALETMLIHMGRKERKRPDDWPIKTIIVKREIRVPNICRRCTCADKKEVSVIIQLTGR